MAESGGESRTLTAISPMIARANECGSRLSVYVIMDFFRLSFERTENNGERAAIARPSLALS